MIIETSITKQKIGKMPKGSTETLKQQMTHLVSKHYNDVGVIMTSASNNRQSVLRAIDKYAAKAFVQETLQDAWEGADDWFVR